VNSDETPFIEKFGYFSSGYIGYFLGYIGYFLGYIGFFLGYIG
jgi:hypothetical protein